ncbi:MAG: N-acetylmuramoyl-L-alanine amidase [Thermomonas sp.]|uniref:N-acetylmuramoyl-L-alanine amidase n=1 Tax=Thermomonas sp. TaxID=1971895 RepID=UPI0039E55B9A
MLLAALVWNLANASEINKLRIETGATGTRAEVQLDRTGSYKLIELSNPDRLVIDFPGSQLARGMALPASSGAIKSVRIGQPQPGTVRVVFDLAGKVKPMPPRLESSADGAVTLILEWPGDGAPAVAATPVPAAARPAEDPIARIASQPMPATQPVADAGKQIDKAATISQLPGTVATGVPTRIATGKPEPVVEQAPAVTAPAPRMAMQPGMRPLVIAIDAGHGGQDPGAVGLNGTREKDVTLAIARELARQINATPGLKAFLTRDSDVFIPLEHRARRASSNKADIFLSIHADAAENRSARGSSVYVLSTRGASSQRARWLADKENAADIIGGERVRVADNTLTSVLLDLTQSGNMKASADAADHVLGGLKQLGKTHKQQIEHANFAVLRTSDKMPAMLVETAFISNPEEEKLLTDSAHQRKMARAILDGIDRYFLRQPPPGTLYAARAQALAGQATVQQASAVTGNTGSGAGGSP